MQAALAKGLMPFYANVSEGQPNVSRLTQAWAMSRADIELFSRMELVSPSPQAFEHFGLRDPQNQLYIPNDNLEYRLADQANTRSGPGGRPISIRDANVLKLQVTYGYQLKVPLVRTIVRKTMCLGVGGGGAVSAWRAQLVPWDAANCVYYLAGRIPLVAQATVQMQTPAYEGERMAGLGGAGGGSTPGGGEEGGGSGDGDGDQGGDGGSGGDNGSGGDGSGSDGGGGGDTGEDPYCPA